jgi:hypothetical protein
MNNLTPVTPSYSSLEKWTSCNWILPMSDRGLHMVAILIRSMVLRWSTSSVSSSFLFIVSPMKFTI